MTCQNQINVFTVFGFARRFDFIGLFGFFQWSVILGANRKELSLWERNWEPRGLQRDWEQCAWALLPTVRSLILLAGLDRRVWLHGKFPACQAGILAKWADSAVMYSQSWFLFRLINEPGSRHREPLGQTCNSRLMESAPLGSLAGVKDHVSFLWLVVPGVVQVWLVKFLLSDLLTSTAVQLVWRLTDLTWKRSKDDSG